MIQFAPAKINLGLSILDKRPDNYHNITSIFLPVYDYCDQLKLSVVEGERGLTIENLGIPIPGQLNKNTCYHLYELIGRSYELPSLKLTINKRIQPGNGFGGGSSNAATFLRMMNEMLKMNWTRQQQKEWLLEIGSDCLFFLDTQPSFVTGRGDEIEQINMDLHQYLIKVYPSQIHVSTSESFKSSCYQKIPSVSLEYLNKDEEWSTNYVNAFEADLYNRYPELQIKKIELLKGGAKYVSITGTGAGMFAIYIR